MGLVDTLVVVLFAVMIVGFPTLTYNGLINKRNSCDAAWASVDTQLQRRHDLIPNVVAVTKSAMDHERGTLESVVRLRDAALSSPSGSARRMAAEDQLTGALGQLVGRWESYPELRANENALHLQRLLTEVESQLSASRRTFNSTVERYNNSVDSFPSSLIANMGGFVRRDWFQASDSARPVPDVRQ